MIERMVDLAADELGIDPAELRRRNYIPPSAMPFKTGLTFTYDCGEFEKNMDLALEIADVKGFKARKAQSRKSGKTARLRHVQHHRARRRRLDRRRRSALRPLRRGDDVLRLESARARATKPCSSNWSATGSASIPNEVQYVQGDTDEVFYGEGTGGSRSATMAGSAFHMASEKIVEQGARHRRASAQGRRDELNFAEGVFSTPRPTGR